MTTPGGTDCTFDVSGRAWKVDDGVLDRPARSEPARGRGLRRAARTGADGMCVIDSSIALAGEGLVDEPIRVTFERGRIVAVEGGKAAETTRQAIAEAGAAPMWSPSSASARTSARASRAA